MNVPIITILQLMFTPKSLPIRRKSRVGEGWRWKAKLAECARAGTCMRAREVGGRTRSPLRRKLPSILCAVPRFSAKSPNF